MKKFFLVGVFLCTASVALRKDVAPVRWGLQSKAATTVRQAVGVRLELWEPAQKVRIRQVR